MAEITFCGVVQTYGISRNSVTEMAVCSASRITAKKYRVISMEGPFADREPDFMPETGQLVAGKARLRGVWDGSILVEFLGAELKRISVDEVANFTGEPFKYVYNPRAEREIILAGKDFYKFRLDTAIFPNQLCWRKGDFPFARLALQFLKANASSMAKLDGTAIFFSWVMNTKIEKSIFASLYEKRNGRRKPGGKKFRRAAMFLLLPKNEEVHTPIFFLADCSGMKLQRGAAYHFKNLPLLCNNDTMPASPMCEAESTLFCGRGDFFLADNPETESLPALHEELENTLYMPDWLWEKYFTEKLAKAELANWIENIGKKMRDLGLAMPDKVHGWWYHWCETTTLRVSDADSGNLAILVPDFRDGGPARILVLPQERYRANRHTFPEVAAAFSIAEEPRIIEGSWKPDEAAWEHIKKWIKLNREVLLQETFYFGDIQKVED